MCLKMVVLLRLICFCKSVLSLSVFRKRLNAFALRVIEKFFSTFSRRRVSL